MAKRKKKSTAATRTRKAAAPTRNTLKSGKARTARSATPARSGKRRLKSPNKSTNTRARPQHQAAPPVIVVGIGASAGGLEVFSELLGALPDDAGLAYVLIQHLAPQNESALPLLLADKTRMPVQQIADGMPVAPNQVYVIPPNAHLTIRDGILHLVPRPAGGGRHTPIDSFFHSLAEYAQSAAIGVVLSGTASDGAMGIRDIKAAGGIAIAQAPQTARYDSMPRAAIATGGVDLILPPAEIAAELARLGRDPHLRQALARPKAQETDNVGPPADEQQLNSLFRLLYKHTGVDFQHYKLPTIHRRLQRRMTLNRISDMEQYLRYLEEYPQEAQKLFQDILIHVTHFFRDPESFDALAEVVFPRLIESRDKDSTIRIWVPGCSTGEEPYSVAMRLIEFLDVRKSRPPVQLFATDVSEPAVDHARNGVYPESIARDVSPERLQRFFSKVDAHYRINMSVRELCVFARQDLSRDPPFSRLDLIVCRNVLIYLGAALQKRLLSVFHYALRPQGFLMLGGAESVGPRGELFTQVEKKHKIFRRKAGESGLELMAPVNRTGAAGNVESRPIPPMRPVPSLYTEANRLMLERYSPPGVLVDADLRIVNFRGQTGLFLEAAPGDASLNLAKMLRRGLLHGVRAAFREARRTGRAARSEGLQIKVDGATRDVTVEVVPLRDSASGRHFLVSFEQPQPGRMSPGKGRGRGGTTAELARLRQELDASRNYLQANIQDLEAANQELQSAYEEILSNNEELQSTNEELDTAKEELQSTNEELNTVNEELHGRNEETLRINSDLMNLLSSVQIAIVIVGGDRRIRRFTSMAEKVLNLIPTDVGRPIAHINPNIDCPDLDRLIQEVIDTVSVLERDVQDAQGNWFTLRIRPYLDLEKRIDGAVLALFDINLARRHEAELRRERDFSRAVFESVRQPLAVLNRDMRIEMINPAFTRFTEVSAADAAGKRLWNLDGRGWRDSELQARLKAIGDGAKETDSLEVTVADGARRAQLSVRRIAGSDERDVMLLIAVEDEVLAD